uniref:R3H domain-containing protein n=1 Tax=Palpitomonas bilix TaxID=652834 RepID=A0A7S3GB61_9EUKA|mmetsp:Transcript_42329/g.108955  ORF Transcript_42329/g.108955 Transcript_42329/m.108955 type:complete len:348 (+) Transcript_42329:131-1174(+)
MNNAFEVDIVLLRALNHSEQRDLVLKLEEDFRSFIELGRRHEKTPEPLHFPPMTSFSRLLLHKVAELFHLETTSVGEEPDRHVVVSYSKDAHEFPGKLSSFVLSRVAVSPPPPIISESAASNDLGSKKADTRGEPGMVRGVYVPPGRRKNEKSAVPTEEKATSGEQERKGTTSRLRAVESKDRSVEELSERECSVKSAKSAGIKEPYMPPGRRRELERKKREAEEAAKVEKAREKEVDALTRRVEQEMNVSEEYKTLSNVTSQQYTPNEDEDLLYQTGHILEAYLNNGTTPEIFVVQRMVGKEGYDDCKYRILDNSILIGFRTARAAARMAKLHDNRFFLLRNFNAV